MAWAKLQQETFTGAKAEAGTRAEELSAERAQVIAGNRTTIESAVETYLDHKFRKARKTVLQYRSTLNQFADAIKDHAHFMDEITPTFFESTRSLWRLKATQERPSTRD